MNNVLFDISMKHSEDIHFILRYKMYCHKGFSLSTTVYAYFQREGSAMHAIDHRNHLFSMKKMVEMCVEGIKNSSYTENFNSMLVVFLKMLLLDMCIYEENYHSIKNILDDLIRDGYYPYKSHDAVVVGRNRKEKLVSFMYKYIFHHKILYLLVCRIRFMIKKLKVNYDSFKS